MKSLKSIYLLISFCLFSSSVKAQCENGDTSTILSTGDVTIHLPNNGNLWGDPNNKTGYTTKETDNPAEQVGMILRGGLWLGGIYPNQQLKVSSVTYSNLPDFINSHGYFPGPLGEDGLTSEADCINFNQQWSVTKTDIEALLSDFADGSIDNPIPDALLRWPAKGNPHFFDLFGFALPDTPQGLAPFTDRNGDGSYDPEQGDTPNIRAADQAVWWVFNDAGGLPVLNYDPLQMEIHALAYSYQSSDPDINNSTFYDFKLINRAPVAVDSFYASLWVDPNLGCYTDDLIGCDPANQLAFVYNENEYDGGPECGDCPNGVADFCGEIPMLGIKLLRGTDRIQNGQVVNNGMSSFSYYGIPSTLDVHAMRHPHTLEGYYNYMNGHWRDGTPISYGGSGYNPLAETITKYAFDGDPSDPNQWSLCSEGLSQADRRILISSGPSALEAGATTRIRFAVFKSYGNTYPCPSLDNLRAVCEKVDAWDSFTTGTKEQVQVRNSAVSFSPNPMIDYGVIRLTEGSDLLEQVGIYALDGSPLQVANNIQAREWKVERTGLRAGGMYLYRLQTTAGEWFSGKIIVL